MTPLRVLGFRKVMLEPPNAPGCTFALFSAFPVTKRYASEQKSARALTGAATVRSARAHPIQILITQAMYKNRPEPSTAPCGPGGIDEARCKEAQARAL